MANARAFDEAVRLALQNPELSVGCHVALLDGAPVLPIEQVPTLAGRGQFRNHDFRSFAFAVMRGEINAEEMENETTAQIRRLQTAGLNVSHIDTHKHV